MADRDPNCFEGASCTAILDESAQTLTFVHRGWTATKQQKAVSPLVVPLGAIGVVEHDWGRFTGWFRVVVRGENPWAGGNHNNPHALTCGEDPAEFADRVRTAVAKAEPMTLAEVYELPDIDDVVVDNTPSVGTKVAKGVGKGIIDGFFRSL